MAKAGAKYLIRYAASSPMEAQTTAPVLAWMAAVEEASEGAIRFEAHWRGTLYKGREILQRVADGSVEMGKLYVLDHPRELPLTQMGCLPFTSVNPKALHHALERLFRDEPGFEAEYHALGVHPIGSLPTGATHLLGIAPVQRLSDLTGKKVRASGVQQDMMRAIGADPIQIPFTELRQRLLAGEVAASTMYERSVPGFGFADAARHFTHVPGGLGFGLGMEIVNLAFWNNLPPAMQHLLQAKLAAAEQDYVQSFEAMRKRDVELLQSPSGGYNVVFHHFDADDAARWRSACETGVYQPWLQCNRDPRDAARILGRFRELLREGEALQT